MPSSVTPLTLDDLTTAQVTGDGVFDTLMRATRGHLELEFKANRIKGPEYSQVYLSGLNSVLDASIQFLLQRRKQDLEAQLLEQEILLAEVKIRQAEAELLIIQANLTKIPYEIQLLQGQVALIEQQKLNLQNDLLTAEAQRAKLVQETSNLVTQNLQTIAETDLIVKKAANVILEGNVLIAQECKLKAEFDLTVITITKTGVENTLLTQKTATEKAQIQNIGVDDNSVIGRQKGLYFAQSEGFQRDAEQKAAKIMVDTWNVRRTTDEGTAANYDNHLDDNSIGRAILKLLAGAKA